MSVAGLWAGAHGPRPMGLGPCSYYGRSKSENYYGRSKSEIEYGRSKSETYYGRSKSEIEYYQSKSVILTAKPSKNHIFYINYNNLIILY